MSIDILNMRRFYTNSQAIDVAFPVLAVECEAKPLLDNSLDAYEEAVLKFLSLGLSARGISQTLNASESLIEEILSHLESMEYAEHKAGSPWQIAKKGKEYLDGLLSERVSPESKFGYMFINAIKKEVLPYFFEGDVGQISLFKGSPLPLKLTVKEDENKTFEPIEIKHAKLKNAYRAYFKNLKLLKDCSKKETSREEACGMFAGADSFEEEPEESYENIGEQEKESASVTLSKNMFIRNLEKKPISLYLRMQIIVDPTVPGGYRAESPFDFDGIDNNFFLSQIQWMEQSDSAYLDKDVMSKFLYREIRKLSSVYKNASKDFQAFALEKMPLLKLYRSHIPDVYDDMERIYSLMQRQNSRIEKENIVSALSRCVIEKLFNLYFRSIGEARLSQIQRKALDDAYAYGYAGYLERICGNAGFDRDALQWIDARYLKTIINRLSLTYGNSITEKFINMLIIEYHFGDARIHKLLSCSELNQTYYIIDKMNQIRRKVSHDTDNVLSDKDYKFYTNHSFDLVNNLLEIFRGIE